MKIVRLLLLAIGVFISLSAMPAHAVGVFDACKTNGNQSSAVCADADNSEATGVVTTIINLMLLVLGITAVILIIHSGIKYVTSRGDPSNIKSAKDTLLYAVIGLIVASLAFTIVNFVLGKFK